LDGLARLHALIAEHLPQEWADLPAEEAAERVVIGIETDRGPWVQALLAAGYVVFAINPMQVARYRQRHSTSGAKSDAGDAHVLAEIVRLDREHHRPVAGNSSDAEAVKLLARTHQSMIWDRTRQLLRLRSALREFFPAALEAFDDLSAADTLELLGQAPDPDRAARLSRSQLAGALRRANRRNIDARAEQLQAVLRAPALRQPAAVQQAYAAIVTGQVRLITALNAEIDALAEVVAEHFGRHRDVEIYLSQPGLGPVLGARVLAEFGDDPDRFADAKSRKNYAGTSPITRASGTRRIVLARYARNRRRADALHQWAFCSLKGSPGARAYYQALRSRGIGHQAALRQLSNRLVGILHGCLKTGTVYNEHTAWSHHTQTAA
jgi:transposase